MVEDWPPYKFVAREPHLIDGIWVMADYWSGYLPAPASIWGDWHHTKISRLWMKMWT